MGDINRLYTFEQTIIYMMVNSIPHLMEAKNALNSKFFVDELNAEFFCLIIDCFKENEQISPVIFGEYLRKTDKKCLCMVSNFYELCVNHDFRIAKNTFSFSIQKLIEYHNNRRIKLIISELSQKIESDVDDHSEYINKFISKYNEINRGYEKSQYNSLEECVYSLIDQSEAEPSFCKTGYTMIDNILYGGLTAQDLLIIGARTSVGKTAFSLNLAYNMATRGKRILFLSTEMTKESIALRLISIATKENAFFKRYDTTWLQKNANVLNLIKNKIEIGFVPGITPIEIFTKVEEFKRTNFVDLVIIDYLQRLKPSNPMKTQYENTSQISDELKDFQLKSRLPWIALAQLSRDVEKASLRPKSSHLKESGKIEENADIILLMYEQPSEIPSGLIEFIISKNRRGRLTTEGEIMYTFKKECQVFYG